MIKKSELREIIQGAMQGTINDLEHKNISLNFSADSRMGKILESILHNIFKYLEAKDIKIED